MKDAKAETTFKEAFQLADEVLQQGVRSITDLMVMPGLINLDFADVRSVMREMGKAMMGTGEGEGENRALEAAERAIANPLLDGVSMAGAKGVIISILGGEDMKLLEVDEAANHIRELVDEDANIIWGSAFNPELEGRIRVSVVATGIEPGAGIEDSSGSTHALSLGGSRAPKRPVLELPDEEEVEETVEETAPQTAFGDALSLGSDDVEEDGEADDLDDDVDDIVDPLAGMRKDVPEPYEPEAEAEPDAGLTDPADDAGNTLGDDDDWGEAEDGGALDLTQEAEPDADSSDDLLRDADRLAAEDKPVEPSGGGRRRGLLAGAGMASASGGADEGSDDAGEKTSGDSGTGGGAAAAAGGSTLFERMANLSRGSASDEEDEEEASDDDDSDSSSLSIPRFLGRQNNQ